MAIGKRQNYPRNMTNFQNPINGLKSKIFHDKKGEKFLNCFFSESFALSNRLYSQNAIVRNILVI